MILFLLKILIRVRCSVISNYLFVDQIYTFHIYLVMIEGEE